MNVYLIDEECTAKQLKQLFQLNCECLKLHWSSSIKDLSEEVVSSLEKLESFVEKKVYEKCTEKELVGSLSKEEEDSINELLEKMPELRRTVGSGVVMAGEEAKEIARILEEKKLSKTLLKAINSGKNVIIY